MGGAWAVHNSSAKEMMKMMCLLLSLLPASSYRTSLCILHCFQVCIVMCIFTVITSTKEVRFHVGLSISRCLRAGLLKKIVAENL